MNKTIILSLSLLLAACAAPEVDRTATNFNETKFDNDLSECQGGNLAEASTKTFGVAVVGSALGAFHGLIGGIQAGNADAGVVIGAAVGGTLGLGVGAAEAVKEHDDEIAGCLRGKGYTLASVVE